METVRLGYTSTEECSKHFPWVHILLVYVPLPGNITIKFCWICDKADEKEK